MKIIIVGAGKIGSGLARSLSGEDHEVYLIEKNEEVARRIEEKIDSQVVVGNGADPDILHKVSVKDADLVLAVTTSDETNLVVCSLAGAFGAKRRIARVRNASLSKALVEIGYGQFHVDEIINPELLAAQAIVRTIQAPGANEVADFADGKILLRAFDIPASSPLCGLKMAELRDEDFPWPFLIISIVRNKQVLIPTGDTTVEANDHIYVLLPAASLGEFLTFMNPEARKLNKVVIYGATITGEEVARLISGHVRDVVLIEEDPQQAETIAGKLKSARIINGSAAEKDILTECGIEAADAFVAASLNDHSNLISSVLAKKLGAKITMITTQQRDYLSIVDAMDIDVIINPHTLAVEQILHLVRGKGVSSVTKLVECKSEALELIPEEGSPITRAPIKDINFPKNAIIGAVYSGLRVVLATGDTQIKPGEKVIIFCQESAVKKVQALFTHKKLFG